MLETKKTWDALTVSGSTDAFGCKGFLNHTFQYTIASINTSVTVRALGSIDEGSNFSNLDASNLDTTHTANGTYSMRLPNTPLDQVKFQFVSEAGGTDVTVTPTYKGA